MKWADPSNTKKQGRQTKSTAPFVFPLRRLGRQHLVDFIFQ